MQKLLSTIAFLACTSVIALFAQTTVADTTIHDAPESLPYPLIKRCNPDLHPGWTQDSVRICGETSLMRLMAQNIQYPYAAREQGLQGTVALQMIIEPTGKISNVVVLKDIGGGCGTEALRVMKVLDTLGLTWMPGIIAGKPVRTRKTLPFRFRLTEVLPYTFSDGGDTIYTSIDAPPQFKEGNEALLQYVLNKLQYPRAYKDSCRTGVIEYALLVQSNGDVKIENQLDFNKLGSDFEYQGIIMVNGMSGQWTPATYQGRPVPATTPLRVMFKSDAPGCKTANENFDRAVLVAEEGVVLSEAQKNAEAIEKFNQALALQPNNTEFLYYRGTLLLNDGKIEDACKDYTRIREILGYTWFEAVRKLVCKW
jgi:TonB family protein